MRDIPDNARAYAPPRDTSTLPPPLNGIHAPQTTTSTSPPVRVDLTTPSTGRTKTAPRRYYTYIFPKLFFSGEDRGARTKPVFAHADLGVYVGGPKHRCNVVALTRDLHPCNPLPLRVTRPVCIRPSLIYLPFLVPSPLHVLQQLLPLLVPLLLHLLLFHRPVLQNPQPGCL